MQRLLFTLLIILIGQTEGLAQQVKLTADKAKSTITYSMKHPLHEWDGVSRDQQSIVVVEGPDKIIRQVAVRVRLNTFDSKNANRDSHMIEVADGLKFPDITFSGNRVEANGDKLMVTGSLRFHGVAKDISFEAFRRNEKNALLVTGAFKVKMSEFGIEPPSLLGLATTDEFNVSFSMVYPY